MKGNKMSLTISLFNSIAEKIDNKSCRICVVGVGYVGEELAYAFSSSGFKNVSAYDTDSEKINEAIRYAFKLTDMYGIERINKSILEASIEFKIDENLLREKINDESFILEERIENE